MRFCPRGFQIGVPGLEPEKLHAKITAGDHIFLETFDVLLRPTAREDSRGEERKDGQRARS